MEAVVGTNPTKLRLHAVHTDHVRDQRREHVRHVKTQIRRSKLLISIGKAYYLCDNGARDNRDLRGAIWNYNHDDTYVTKVLDQAHQYAAAASVGTGDCTAIQAPNPTAAAAINYACGQRGLPYLWGGDGPQEGGFDCSGLTAAAYRAAGITLPRTADAQYRAGPHIPNNQPVLPGDLVFYGTTAHIHHVGLYIGGGLMIDAPDVGQTVDRHPYRYRGDDYVGATRPVNSQLL